MVGGGGGGGGGSLGQNANKLNTMLSFLNYHIFQVNMIVILDNAYCLV